MDQRAGEEERNSEDLTDHQRKDDVDAATEDPGMNNHGEFMDHQRDDGGYEEAEETVGVLKEVEVEVEVEVVGGSEEEASAPLSFAHPYSLLQLLLRACAGCLGLRGYDYPKPAADDDDAAAPAVAESPQDGEGGGDKGASEVGTRVRRPSPPRRPREGPGGDGGKHN